MSQPAKLALLAAFEPGWENARFVLNADPELDFVATCAGDGSPFEERIAALARQKGVPVHRRAEVNSPEFIQTLAAAEPDIVMLAWWPDIVKKKAIDSAKIGWTNLHPALLPFGRGKHPYYWSIVEGKPFGATIHFIDEGTDTGPVLFQREIKVDIADTGQSLYKRSVIEIIDLFKENYLNLANLDFSPAVQDESKATFHWAREIEPHSRIDLNREYTGRELIDIIRARTFRQGDSAWFKDRERKYRLKLLIEPVPGKGEESE